MGSDSAKRPKRLAGKLYSIRRSLGLSQNGLIRLLNCEGELQQSQVSAFERGTRTPSLTVLLAYARHSNISMEILVDDEMDLPPRLENR